MTHYHASNKTAAWRLANALFPTDYEYDVRGSERAGYPIYTSTCDTDNSHISDLEARIELNIWHDKEIETITIWIDSEEKAKSNADMVSKDDIINYIEKKIEAYNRLPNTMPDRLIEAFAHELLTLREMAESLTGERIEI